MRFLALALLLCLLIPNTKADAWDDLTKEEAQKLLGYLERNPFVFDYCDCCTYGEGEAGPRLIKLTKIEIVDCDWKEGYYSIKYEAQVLANIGTVNNRLDLTSMENFGEGSIEGTIYLNYTWGFNWDSKVASPLFDIIDYASYPGNRDACAVAHAYPSPAALKSIGVKDNEYKKWYKAKENPKLVRAKF